MDRYFSGFITDAGFHRLDSAVWKSVLACPAAEEVFDIAAALDSLYGSGEGKLLLRSVGTLFQGEAPHDTMRAGGTREIAYVSKVPGRILENLPVYMVALHARIAWKRAGHGKQSLASLLAIGRRICSLSFASWLSFFCS